MSYFTFSKEWECVFERAKVPHISTHGIRHRAATQIANSGVLVKVVIQLTGNKTAAQVVHYVHTEDEAVQVAAEKVAQLRQAVPAVK